MLNRRSMIANGLATIGGMLPSLPGLALAKGKKPKRSQAELEDAIFAYLDHYRRVHEFTHMANYNHDLYWRVRQDFWTAKHKVLETMAREHGRPYDHETTSLGNGLMALTMETPSYLIMVAGEDEIDDDGHQRSVLVIVPKTERARDFMENLPRYVPPTPEERAEEHRQLREWAAQMRAEKAQQVDGDDEEFELQP